MADKIRWGILGTGGIAHKFATGLQSAPEAELAAVGSRSQATADKFGDRFKVPGRHASYEALVSDPDVDVIYVSTPHPFHKENTMLCLNAGKAVLCEKPFALNVAETEEMINLARQKGLFLMEAMWNRYLPAVIKLRQLIAEDVLGEIRMLIANFGFRADFDPQGRLFDLDLGGGALLDAGIYPVSFSSMIFGSPVQVASMAYLGQTGADEQSVYLLSYPQGQLAQLASAVSTDMPSEAIVMGTKGRVKVHGPIYCPTRLTLTLNDKDEVIDAPLVGNGYNYEADEVMSCLRAGKLESDIMPLDETLAIMRTMDQIRAPWGLNYPTE
jgi:predicted dehydrogenase